MYSKEDLTQSWLEVLGPPPPHGKTMVCPTFLTLFRDDNIYHLGIPDTIYF